MIARRPAITIALHQSVSQLG